MEMRVVCLYVLEGVVATPSVAALASLLALAAPRPLAAKQPYSPDLLVILPMRRAMYHARPRPKRLARPKPLPT